jgi:hypothetical protein
VAVVVSLGQPRGVQVVPRCSFFYHSRCVTFFGGGIPKPHRCCPEIDPDARWETDPRKIVDRELRPGSDRAIIYLRPAPMTLLLWLLSSRACLTCTHYGLATDHRSQRRRVA